MESFKGYRASLHLGGWCWLAQTKNHFTHENPAARANRAGDGSSESVGVPHIVVEISEQNFHPQGHRNRAETGNVEILFDMGTLARLHLA